jgi:hypothetical protein
MHRAPSRPAGNTRSHGAQGAHDAASRPAQPARRRSGLSSTAVASILGFAATAGIGGVIAWSSGCYSEPPPGSSTERPARGSKLPPPPPQAAARPSAAPSAVAQVRDAGPPPDAQAAAVAVEPPYTGPLLAGLALQTPVYPAREFSNKRLGYIRLGGKVPVDPVPAKTSACTQGWYRLLDGGFVCGKYATVDMNNPVVKLGVTSPNLEEVLPYRYAYNTGHGTPLYRSVPSKEDMIRYEPYLEVSKRARRKAKEAEEQSAAAEPAASAAASSSPPALSRTAEAAPRAETAPVAPPDEGVEGAVPASDLGLLDAGAPAVAEDTKPWWQQTDSTKPLSVTLRELEQEADGTVAKRMVKGFFVAIDKTFGWNSRLWYKTTSGLVAPADRMYIAKPPSSQGIDFPAGAKQVGFITASKASKYEFDSERKKVSVLGPIPRFTAFGLTGTTLSHKTTIYRQTTDGWWMKGADGTFAEPGPPPADLAPGEKWIDVNLTRKTLVAIEGDTPVFAALVSPGKKSKNKQKDHSTVQGTFRIREKHISVTMDGDGTVAGDLPYSIEDVPYVAYFDRSYALHGAFWHNNFGREMSHGCVNLSPLDAKRVFFWSGPRLPRGWHAVWSSSDNRGTIVTVHE